MIPFALLPYESSRTCAACSDRLAVLEIDGEDFCADCAAEAESRVTRAVWDRRVVIR